MPCGSYIYSPCKISSQWLEYHNKNGYHLLGNDKHLYMYGIKLSSFIDYCSYRWQKIMNEQSTRICCV